MMAKRQHTRCWGCDSDRVAGRWARTRQMCEKGSKQSIGELGYSEVLFLALVVGLTGCERRHQVHVVDGDGTCIAAIDDDRVGFESAAIKSGRCVC